MIDFLINGNSFGFLGGILTTIAFVPQVYKVWLTKNFRHLRFITSLFQMIGNICYVVFGYLMQINPIIACNTIVLVCLMSILIMKIYFGACFRSF